MRATRIKEGYNYFESTYKFRDESHYGGRFQNKHDLRYCSNFVLVLKFQSSTIRKISEEVRITIRFVPITLAENFLLKNVFRNHQSIENMHCLSFGAFE